MSTNDEDFSGFGTNTKGPGQYAAGLERRIRPWVEVGRYLGFAFVLLSSPQDETRAGSLGACAATGPGIQVVAQQLRSSDGLLTVELYDDNPEGFIKKSGRIKRVRVGATEGQTEMCLTAPGPGRYAVGVYHDENANKKFDKNFLGIPTEGFGVSNNPGFDFGPPSHEDSAFELDGQPLRLEIKVVYL